MLAVSAATSSNRRWATRWASSARHRARVTVATRAATTTAAGASRTRPPARRVSRLVRPGAAALTMSVYRLVEAPGLPGFAAVRRQGLGQGAAPDPRLARDGLEPVR